MHPKVYGFSILLLFLFSFLLQSQLYQHWDLLFVLEGGRRLLEGGNYLKDLFDTNPPLIYYFGMGVVLLSQWTGLSSPFIYKSITYMLVGYSLGMSYYVLGIKDLAEQNIRTFLIPVLALCFLIIPIFDIGEREHLMIVLTMPYFLLGYQGTLVSNGSSFSQVTRLIISVLAGLGFALKPHFLFAFLFTELLLVYWKKNWRNLLRLEPLIVIVVQVIYWLAIAFLMPSFYQQVLSLVLQFYAFNRNSLFVVLNNPALFALLISLGISLFLPRPWPRLNQLFLVLSLAFTITYLLQAKGWYYHIVPLITVNVAYMALLGYQFLKEPKPSAILLSILLGSFFMCIIQPAYLGYRNLIACHNHDTCNYLPLIELAKKQAKREAIFFFSTYMQYSIPIIYYSETQLASRFSAMWLIAGIVNKERVLKVCDSQCLAAKKQVRTYIVEDFKRYKPKLVFVDISLHKAYIKGTFDYLNFMQKAPEFKRLWENYSYLTTNHQYVIYKRKSFY